MKALERYRGELARLEVLDPERERELARACRRGDEGARRRLVEATLPFVVFLARRYVRWGVPLEDLIQQGNLGLLEAVARFDPDKGCRLSSYAQFWIRAAIREYVVRQHRAVRLGTTRTERRALWMYRRGEARDAAALAEASGMPLAVAERLVRVLGSPDLRLDDRADGTGSRVERLSDPEADPEREAGRRRERERVRAAVRAVLPALDARERRILEARLMSDAPTTLEALGAEMGVTKERVRQLEVRLRHKLQVELAAVRPEAA
ncbi:MAG: sigma-70 family RNA polymerase sigma factor [Myxococcota bacterium]